MISIWSCEHVDVIFVILDIKLPYEGVGMYWNKFFIIFSKKFEESFQPEVGAQKKVETFFKIF